MDVKIYPSKYKNIDGFLLENERLVVTVLPEQGGKIQSIRDKETNREYLYQSPWSDYKKPAYDFSYENGEFSGFDEMFPTISECFYPADPWKGIRIPDHGEVWSQPWEYECDDSSILMKVYGVRFPYQLVKKVEFIKEKIIRINYKVINHSNYDFNFIWAAHPLFNCDETTRLILPESVKKIINTVSGSRLGEFGDIHTWPLTLTTNGQILDLSRISPRASNCYEKYYVDGKAGEGWCALHDEKTGDVIGLSYPVDKVEYLGLWINEGGYADQYNVALEPCTGALDRLDTSVQWNQTSVLKSGATNEWYLNLSFANATQIKGIDTQGNILKS